VTKIGTTFSKTLGYEMEYRYLLKGIPKIEVKDLLELLLTGQQFK